MKSVEAIKKFFEAGSEKRITLAELKALNVDERAELAKLACVELGTEFEESR
jgi:hypothetical protein